MKTATPPFEVPPGLRRPRTWTRDSRVIALALTLAALAVVYFPTLLTTINGSSDDLMADVGESQIVLNTWGTLHATGYPLFVIFGNLLVSALRTLGVSPAAAPSLVAMFCGMVALALLYLLLLRLTGRVLLAAGTVFLFGLTRLVWLHNVVPEVYSFALLFTTLLLLLALEPNPRPIHLVGLAFLGGMAIGHHRALILAVPPVLYGVWPALTAETRKRPLFLVGLLLVGLFGLVPYIYLPLRAWSGAAWVYGEPGTLSGLWDQFMGRESPGIVGWPESWQVIGDKAQVFGSALVTELSVPGILLGMAGLALALYSPARRRAATVLILSGLETYLFDLFLFNDLIAPVVLPITQSLVAGWALLFDRLYSAAAASSRRLVVAASAAAGLLAAGWLVSQNYVFIYELTHDPSASQTIAFAAQVPSGSTLMLDWGQQYFAVGFAQDVLGQLRGIRRADAKADFAQLIREGPLVTPDYTFFQHPVRWWKDRLETRVYLRSIGPHLVQIDTAAETWPADREAEISDPSIGVASLGHQLHCTLQAINLQVDWAALSKPTRNLSVFVHLLNARGEIIGQADESAPVYGWRPLTDWEPGELVRDVYPLERKAGGSTIRFGLYEPKPDGAFENHIVIEIAAECPSAFSEPAAHHFNIASSDRAQRPI